MQDFSGINEKLIRAEENIFYLDKQISLFFQESDYPVLPKSDGEEFLKAIEYHKNRVVPPRFSVLAGEIVHHLRSCFDHVVWHFSVGPKQNDMPIDFPVFQKKAIQKNDVARFEGKIQRIADVHARALIERLQPYNAANPSEDPLWIIHDFDIIDKHRALVMGFTTGTIFFPTEMKPIIDSYQRAHPELDRIEVAHEFQSHALLMPYISFRDFGGRTFQPVIPGLVDLFNYTVNAMRGFEAL